MSPVRVYAVVGVLLGCCALAGFQHGRSQSIESLERGAATKDPTFTQTLPPLQGDRLKLSLVEVTYAPGGSSSPHSHPCPVVGHVVEGSVKMQVKGQQERTFAVGENFYEPPNGVHLVSANASQTRAAKFIAIFICDRQTELSVPVSGESGADR